MKFEFNKNWFTHRFGLKLWALVMAIIVWLYVNGEVHNKPSGLF